MSRTLLITGASGYLGRELARQAVAAEWQVIGTYHRSPQPIDGVQWQQVDVRDQAAVGDLIRLIAPAAVIHAAIIEPSEWATNADGAAHVALAARSSGARLIHLSSDAIFGGSSDPYAEDALPDPITPYGAAKAAAETAVKAIDPGAAIVRTSLIIGDEPYKHVQMVLDMLDGRRDDALFTDEIRCPVAVGDLAAAVLELINHDYAGVINIAGSDALSRYDLGVLIAQRWEYDPTQLRSTTTTASGLRRPTDVRLDSSRARSMLKTRLRGAREFLEGETRRQGDKEIRSKHFGF